MGKEAQNDQTATLETNARMPTSSDETVDPTGKRKQAKRSSDEQDPADLRQPKDPDPEPEPVALVEAEVKAILGNPITLTFLRNLCNDAVDEIAQGNERFRAFQDQYAAKFVQPCLYFDDLFKTATDVISCEELMNDIFKMQDNDSQCVIQLLVGLINPDEGEDIDDPYVWAIRELTMRIAQQDPTKFFKINDARTNPDSMAMHSFWDRSDGDEFRLRTDSVAVQFWVISSCLLGHPWRYFFHIETPDPHPPRELDFPPGVKPAAEEQMLAEMKQKPLTSLEKQALAFQKYFSQKKQKETSNSEHRVGKILDFESSGTTETISKERAAKSKQSKISVMSVNNMAENLSTQQRVKKAKQKEGGVHFKDVVLHDLKSATDASSKKKRKEKENSLITSPARGRQKSDDGSKPVDKQSAKAVAMDNEVVVMKIVQHHDEAAFSEDEIEYTGTKKGDQMEPEDGDGTGDVVMMTKNEAEKEDETWAENQRRASYAEVTSRQVNCVLAGGTISDQVKRMTQVDVYGMPGLAWFYELAFSMTWNGNQSDKSITKAWVKIIVDALVEALKNSEDGLRLLPFSDATYKDQKLWIRNERECREKIKTFRDLQKYIDMDYGNAQYTASNNKPGDKVFRHSDAFWF